MFVDDGFDLAELDAEAADLDLVVDAPEVERARRGGAWRGRRCGRASVAERVGQEPLRRQLGPVEVAARDAGPADEQLSRNALGDRLEPGVEHVGLEVGNRLPDRADVAVAVRCRERTIGDVNGRLGDPVHVHQSRPPVAEPIEPGTQRRRLERLAAEDDQAQRQRVGPAETSSSSAERNRLGVAFSTVTRSSTISSRRDAGDRVVQ